MDIAIQKWGNSAAMRLPSAVLKQLRLGIGDSLEVEVREDGILLKPKRVVYSLDALVAQCEPGAPLPDDMQLWGQMRPVGRETW